MLQIRDICKKYVTGDLVQEALDGVSLNLRDNEFVAILGPSGSGKTTLLNIIGGLDRYDSGDVIINGVSTKQYKDRDWDSYRNHTIGFVFQSYNLIPHQSVLANVELALTISGISGKERRRRAVKALEQVGLGDQIHKRPSQMSGGQMQRVAIARALVNDPDILLADEPTGALDTETSIQVMELLKKVASDRLVVMVTHNPELADAYASRIVRLRDGKVTDDTDPCPDDGRQDITAYKNLGKSSMSLRTALALSFNNLTTKKARTLLTAFAGSIGIIGIALILSMSNGVNTYIEDVQKSTMTSYPITIEKETIDLSGVMTTEKKDTQERDRDAVYINTRMLDSLSALTSSVSSNNLTAFYSYLNEPDCPLQQYVGENGIVYSYETKYDVYTHDENGELIDTGASGTESSASGMMSMVSAMSSGSSGSMMVSNAFTQLLPAEDGMVSSAVKDSYDLLYGSWPSTENELVLMLNRNGELGVKYLHQLGFLSNEENDELLRKVDAKESLSLSRDMYSFEEICEKEYYLIPRCDLYRENEQGLYSMVNTQESVGEIDSLLDEAITLHISAIVCPKEDGAADTLNSQQTPIGYTKALTDFIIAHTAASPVVQAQKANQDKNILNGMAFDTSTVDKAQAAKEYLNNLSGEERTQVLGQMMKAFVEKSPMGKLMESKIAGMDEEQLAEGMMQYLDAMADDEAMTQIYDYFVAGNTGSYEENMESFGVVDPQSPMAVNIYADTFENKDNIENCIKEYNESVSEKDRIVYTDFVGMLMSSVTTIINTISYVLIAFVAISLIVSSIMIGIITYISVLERTKEIGILRAIGASKRNISNVFNAETFIIGIASGTMGIAITCLLLIPINRVIHALAQGRQVSAILPVNGALILIILSILLTMLGGFIPSRKAARKDPVAALRSA